MTLEQFLALPIDELQHLQMLNLFENNLGELNEVQMQALCDRLLQCGSLQEFFVSSPKLRVTSSAASAASSTPAITFYRQTLTSKSLNELAQPIDHALIQRMEKKGWTIVVAKEGDEHFRYLSMIGADASINTGVPKHILIKEAAPKSSLLEEYLHGTQLELGLLEKYGSTQALEVHVKEFMLRHVKMLGLDNPHDIQLLQQLKLEEIERLVKLTGK